MKTKEDAKKALFDIKEILEKNNLLFCLDGGTLLGAIRDKDFCKDDWDDIDLTVCGFIYKAGEVATAFFDITVLVEQASEKKFELYHYWEPDQEKKHSGQISFIRDGIKVDIMFKQIKGENSWWTVYRGSQVVYKSVPKKFYDDMVKIPFLTESQDNKNWFFAPKDFDGYLTLRYGDWKTPVHRRQYSCYTSDKCIKKSYEDII